MANKKSAFWTFIFSFIPGAGEMYMGFFKQGLSLMGLCALLSVVESWLHLEVLMVFLPLIWFYSFFHVHHLRSLPPDEFYAIEDKFLFFPWLNSGYDATVSEKWNTVRRQRLAIVLLLVGAVLLWNVCMDGLSWILPEGFQNMVWWMQNIIGRLAVAAAILYAGFHMLRGSKK